MTIVEARPVILNTELALNRRKETPEELIRRELRGLDVSQRSHAILQNGDLRTFYRHDNGDGWFEEGKQVPDKLHVTRDAVLFLSVNIPGDAVSAHGSDLGVSFRYRDYY